MDIKRWEITDRWGEDGISGEEPGGDWVLYEDHARVVRSLQEEIERLKARYFRLLADTAIAE